nr:hypothetical protein CFP56_13427 [Quercus suber]
MNRAGYRAEKRAEVRSSVSYRELVQISRSGTTLTSRCIPDLISSLFTVLHRTTVSVPNIYRRGSSLRLIKFVRVPSYFHSDAIFTFGRNMGCSQRQLSIVQSNETLSQRTDLRSMYSALSLISVNMATCSLMSRNNQENASVPLMTLRIRSSVRIVYTGRLAGSSALSGQYSLDGISSTAANSFEVL